jgi:hypothetical protein
MIGFEESGHDAMHAEKPPPADDCWRGLCLFFCGIIQ